jgi:protein-S-isoprenylcysteine O-methyltransferase Ste14
MGGENTEHIEHSYFAQYLAKELPMVRQDILQRVSKDFVGTLLVTITLFIAAGRLNWVMGWVYVGLNFLGLVVNVAVLTSRNPEMYAARAQVTREDTKTWDKIFTSVYGPLLLVIMAVSGLDAGRFGWSTVPIWVQMVSIAVFILAWMFALWAMVSNRHFETSVRIQTDRSHTTVTSGPYAIMRHPGYVGVILLYAATPPFLGSWWGLIASGVLAVAFLIRTAWEDKTLLEELPGYTEYAALTRYRLLPGVW